MPPLPLSRPLAPLGGVSDLTSKVSGEEQGQRMWQGGEGLSSRRWALKADESEAAGGPINRPTHHP
ncbi:Os08g0120350 [Oryza sativa Japonica Group]|uniref:Os08g0120350 protein n=3 Tax=Oryza TaxID=4527 RepID=C7J688_ORYSJ|nr:Os08g0120350 [Oryza sativa Japonica Group]|eukprot:NP_001175361.1 Os08g0120350 [Oryza sativa Japonica Group]